MHERITEDNRINITCDTREIFFLLFFESLFLLFPFFALHFSLVVNWQLIAIKRDYLKLRSEPRACNRTTAEGCKVHIQWRTRKKETYDFWKQTFVPESTIFFSKLVLSFISLSFFLSTFLSISTSQTTFLFLSLLLCLIEPICQCACDVDVSVARIEAEWRVNNLELPSGGALEGLSVEPKALLALRRYRPCAFSVGQRYATATVSGVKESALWWWPRVRALVAASATRLTICDEKRLCRAKTLVEQALFPHWRTRACG